MGRVEFYKREIENGTGPDWVRYIADMAAHDRANMSDCELHAILSYAEDKLRTLTEGCVAQ